MSDLNKLVEELSTLTVLEAADLVKKLEEKWGVSAAAPVAMAAMPAAGGCRSLKPSKKRPNSTWSSKKLEPRRSR